MYVQACVNVCISPLTAMSNVLITPPLAACHTHGRRVETANIQEAEQTQRKLLRGFEGIEQGVAHRLTCACTHYYLNIATLQPPSVSSDLVFS